MASSLNTQRSEPQINFDDILIRFQSQFNSQDITPWTVGQCRQLMAEYDINPFLMKSYLSNQRTVRVLSLLEELLLNDLETDLLRSQSFEIINDDEL